MRPGIGHLCGAAANASSDAYTQALLATGLYVQSEDGSVSFKGGFAIKPRPEGQSAAGKAAEQASAAYVQSLLATGLYVQSEDGSVSFKGGFQISGAPELAPQDSGNGVTRGTDAFGGIT